jgi:hypothetical protein
VPTPPHTQHLDLTDREAAQLDAYAKAHGLTQQQAATQLAQQTLEARYRIKQQQGRVLPFRRRT